MLLTNSQRNTVYDKSLNALMALKSEKDALSHNSLHNIQL